MVSIHALLAECDAWRRKKRRKPKSFNPRTPCGVRQPFHACHDTCARFQSTHSLRSATGSRPGCGPCQKPGFNPRTPCGVRPAHPTQGPSSSLGFNPRTPCGVRRGGRRDFTGGICFNPRTPCGVRPVMKLTDDYEKSFNPRTPCGVRLYDLSK